MDPKLQLALAALKLLVPLIEQHGLAGVRDLVKGREDNLVLSFQRRDWSPTHQGDPKNDYPGDILSKWADDGLFVLAQQLPGDLSDQFRDRLSPIVTPAVRARLDENSTAEDVAREVTEEVAALAERVIQAVAP